MIEHAQKLFQLVNVETFLIFLEVLNKAAGIQLERGANTFVLLFLTITLTYQLYRLNSLISSESRLRNVPLSEDTIHVNETRLIRRAGNFDILM